MSKALNRFKLAGLGAVSLALAACGDSTKTDTEVGSFMKGQAGGVIYMTESRTGMTDENGAFLYEPGESVSFYIGGTKLGATVPAVPQISPMDLVTGVTIPVASAETAEFIRQEYDDFGTHEQTDLRHELLNILMYLYSADKDKDSSNGIMIDSAFHTQFTESYDLKIRSNRFDNIDGFERKFYQAYAAGAVDSARIIRRYKALDDFAKLQGLTPQVAVVAHEYYDRNADGMDIDIDQFFADPGTGLYGGVIEDGEIYNYNYNQYGDYMGSSDDYDGDGTPEYVSAYTRDVHGNTLRRDYEDLEGGSKSWTTYVYNEFGQELEENRDYDGDGNWNEREFRQYDANGNQTYYAEDEDGDGNLDYVEFWQFDAIGNESYYAEDEDGDGNLDYIQTANYDANGNQTEVFYDNDGDGTFDTSDTYEYNADGQRTFSYQDIGVDGTYDSISETVYENGNAIEHRHDSDADGVVDNVSYSDYDAEGWFIGYRYDRGFDGIIDSQYFYERDANGNLIRVAYDWEADGVIDSEYLYEYDAMGNQTRRAFDWNGDGVLDLEYIYEYDAEGNRIKYERYRNGSDTPYRIYTYDYMYTNFLGYYTWD